MKYSLFLIAVIGFGGLATTFIKPQTEVAAVAEPKPSDLVVHEWGTFTTIAGKNGVALDWRPLNGPSDLPRFVYSRTSGNGYRGTYDVKGKGDLARVRMETPVIYFYTKEAMDVAVSVGFPEGKVTEWYPQASVVNAAAGRNKTGGFVNGTKASGITWGTIRLLPDETPDYLREAEDSHYYPARETDSVPVQVCNADQTKIEKEKFLFYRGIGNFALPLKVRLAHDKVILGTIEDKFGPKSNPGRSITGAILFENRGGRIGYQVVPFISGDTPVDRPVLNRSIADVYAELEKTLILQGLYEKEARAMIETWKDSWFEEGLRLLYILPRMSTDEVLPLNVSPRPKETVRVLVGRAEVITPEMERAAKEQVNLLRSSSAVTRSDAARVLKKYGRFYEPVLKIILETETDPAVKKQLQRLIAMEGSG
jgi:hypothetical protein